jgi:hypothetical protein
MQEGRGRVHGAAIVAFAVPVMVLTARDTLTGGGGNVSN